MKKELVRQAVSPKKLSEIYDIDVGTLANWRHKRVGPKFYKCGARKVLYFIHDVEQWAKSNPILTRDSR
jgi:hypothetical protein